MASHTVRIAVAAILIALLPTPTNGQTFSADLNPSGDPIAGGNGYSKILTEADADAVVSTKSQLLAALSAASSGDVVFVDPSASIDMTGTLNTIIPGGVTLASDRGRSGSKGALLFTNQRPRLQDQNALLRAGGPGVRVTGLRLQGPTTVIADRAHRESVGIYGIVTDATDFEVDNNEFYGWGLMAVKLDPATGCYVHHNYIHHNRVTGAGYGVWVAKGGPAEIDANLFDANRHSIASSSNSTASWRGRYNVVLDRGNGHSFDRHSRDSRAQAGLDTFVENNWFWGGGTNLAIRGEAWGSATFSDNWTAASSLTRAVRIDTDQGVNESWFTATGNRFSNQGIRPPVARITTNVDRGKAPLTVTFDARSSTDAEGGTITSYLWQIPDGSSTLGVRSEEATLTYTFNDPGVYNVEMLAMNEYGVPGRAMKAIVVEPSESRYILSAWLMDSYLGSKSGFYKKQILVNNNVVWESDVAGEDDWEHVVVPVDQFVSAGSNAVLAFRLYVATGLSDPENQIEDIYLYIDDVHLFGGEVSGGTCESSSSWPARDNGGTWSVTTTAGEMRSIRASRRIGSPMGEITTTGRYVEVHQSVQINALEPGGGGGGGGGGGQDTWEGVVPTGWSIISADLQPANPDMSEVFRDHSASVQIVKDDMGRVYAPDFGVNDIGDWEVTEGYSVNARTAMNLVIEGSRVDPSQQPISLETSWNLIPYLRSSSMPIQEALSSIADNLVLVKDAEGQMYYPELGIDGIGMLTPGAGYQVYVSAACTLTYPPN